MKYYAWNAKTIASITVEDGIVTEFEEQIDFQSEFGIDLKKMVGKSFEPSPIWKTYAPHQATAA